MGEYFTTKFLLNLLSLTHKSRKNFKKNEIFAVQLGYSGKHLIFLDRAFGTCGTYSN
jgi:hypothetical protein